MRHLRQILILVIFLVGTVKIAFSQRSPILGQFSISTTDGKVFLNWSIVSGATCNGIQIYRSADTSNFSQIGEIPGVCGSASFEQFYNYTDYHPLKNQLNYYRLELGSLEYSQTVSIEVIDIEYGGYQIRPQPANTAAKIYFENNNKQEYDFSLFDLKGQKLLTASGKEDYFALNTTDVQSGLYFFTISNPGKPQVIKGKLMVLH
ncbi:MAG: T9SS type A sorting domain-containing protein [Bacteroidetes bacterium]|nr:T9SS type A sorting domain-containing protein [Bacteroidota bacterium]MBK9671227.1 T9SS type A sorting domain-containing protein [Bacteroidota bacterium]MBP6412950.1 T9SS type A sorting domain-containing protein [Bacteroidia bacterium]